MEKVQINNEDTETISESTAKSGVSNEMPLIF